MSVVKSKYVTKDGRKWIFQVSYRKSLQGDLVRYTSPRFKKKEDAEEAQKKFLLRCGNLQACDMTFNDLYQDFFDYQRDKVKSNTLRSYKERFKYLSDTIGRININDFDATHYVLWRKELQRFNLNDTTRNNIQKLLKTLLNYATKWYSINYSFVYPKIEPFRNPNQVVEKEINYYSYEEYKQFISAEDDFTFKVLFEVLYFLGLRVGECRALTFRHIDFINHEVKINSNVVRNCLGEGDKNYLVTSPKTRSSIRTLPIPSFLVKDLEILKQQQQQVYGFKDTWYVFGSFDPISYDRIRLRAIKNAKISGVKHLTPHEFRHSCASLLVSQGANITLLSRYLGHSDIQETLNTYSHFFKNDLDNVVSCFDNLDGIT